MDRMISIVRGKNIGYPDKKDLFRPDKSYPEYLFDNDISEFPNRIYQLVRENFILREMDYENRETAAWNPLKDFVHPGDYVVLKPNMVMDHNPSGDGVECLYTHPSVVAAVLDYVFIALKGTGFIVIGDAPMQECNFEKLIKESGYGLLLDYYTHKIAEKRWQIQLRLEDFRGFRSAVKYGVHIGEKASAERGMVIDLGTESEFSIYEKEHLERLRITNYNPEILAAHHTPDKHEYYISEDILRADVVINMPKPKTHRKAGVTIALKNLVGINVRKEYLPHHCVGAKDSGGDEYNRSSLLKMWKSRLLDRINYHQTIGSYQKAFWELWLRRFMTVFIRLSKDQTWEGSWYGNETISKTIADLNKILVYADKEGELQDSPQRKCFIVADMMISGEKEGPVMPNAKPLGIIAMGDQPVCFDEAIATLMGMDIKKIPVLRQTRNLTGKRILVQKQDKAKILSNVGQWDGKYIDQLNKGDLLRFVPSGGWLGHIEA